ncbi:MAG TPA: hypothetical protein VFS21_16665, partial [Roseiflexaceae bacterium]|nr:hypothetical protein [Roseiflexaceae bacterium]
MATNVGNVGPKTTPSLQAKRSAHARRNRMRAGHLLTWMALCLGGLTMLLPFLWLVSTSLKEQQQIFRYPPEWIPNPVRWQNYPE